MNIKAGRPKTEILNKLNILIDIADLINRQQRKSAFGHLHVVFRDWEVAVGSRETTDHIMGEEDPDAARTDEGAALCEKRNEIRKKLPGYFQSITFHCLPHPNPGKTPENFLDVSESSSLSRTRGSHTQRVLGVRCEDAFGRGCAWV
jgi:hypothetical protein